MSSVGVPVPLCLQNKARCLSGGYVLTNYDLDFRIFPFLLPVVKDSKALLWFFFFFFLVFQFHDAYVYEGRSEEEGWLKMAIG